ncbi:uncharacterized protein LOC135597569 [Musa acuminata AAA Group]|uniref:uncharacterized protein LOC135597569 n=1 Tax=Musa acuminata AAA Group TaxID=214697 RepID=UPI0031DE90AA
MGNGASCVPRIRRAEAGTAKVVGPDGVLRRIEAPAGAAEIMMEYPGHVVARAEEVARTRRVAGMRADEELLAGGAYLLLPMDRVGCRLSDGQIEVLLDVVRGRRRRRGRKEGSCGGGGRVFPEVAGGEEGKTAVLGGEVTGFSGKRVGGCRQWRPALDTIHESKSN